MTWSRATVWLHRSFQTWKGPQTGGLTYSLRAAKVEDLGFGCGGLKGMEGEVEAHKATVAEGGLAVPASSSELAAVCLGVTAGAAASCESVLLEWTPIKC